ncbi:IS3 family transposase [Enterococcus sp. AZ072]|uniref:IS3 family transposase n=1 Tax=unclassified Enterococcus TaxID=2608891 RepID=UPI003D2E044F
MAAYQAIKFLHEEMDYPIKPLCELLRITRSAYYRWLKHPESVREQINRQITKDIRTIHEKHPDMGYRRIKDELKRTYKINVNDKRVLRICRHEQIQSRIKHPANCITRRAYAPYYKAKNVLRGQFHAEAPNQKWVTDVSEFKYFIGPIVKKLYLSAILDLYDHRIVTYVLSDTNDLDLVFDTFDQAVELEPEAHPIFHSDQGFQYTHVNFFRRIVKADMIQSMSRVGKCTDNGPMEGFWGMLKRENYYGRKFTSREELVTMITDYMKYYNTGRYQRKLQVMTPMEFHNNYYKAA